MDSQCLNRAIIELIMPIWGGVYAALGYDNCIYFPIYLSITQNITKQLWKKKNHEII